jgi:TRAP transporter 4TM/12TM fusion protein
MEQGKLMDNKNLKETTQTDETKKKRRMVEVEDIHPTAVMDTAGAADTADNIEQQTKEIMQKYDRESNIREFKGVPRKIVRYLLVFFSLYAVFLLFYPGETRFERASFVGYIVFMVYVMFPVKMGMQGKINYIPWYDIILGLLSAASYGYFIINLEAILQQGIMLTPAQIVFGVIGIVTTLEACRRAIGLPIVIVALIMIIYGLTQKSLALNVYNLFYTTEGIIGIPTRACLNYIVLFVIFGAFLEKTGISQFFIDIAYSIAGASTGGPAKVAVISSALCGMVSGSSVGNTVTTGSVTIPLMKKTGYKPEFAGAVEAAASTGGQIMPPIMGAAAFLMVEYTGMSYGSIALRAAIPAFLYFAGIFIIVHLEAKKLGLQGVPREELPSFWGLVKHSGYLLLPLIVLVILLIKTTMALAAIWATICAIAVSMIRKETRMSSAKFFDALENGARSTLTVGIACAAAGIIACIITTTGIGRALITFIVGAAGGKLIIALVLTMLTCIVLGMGVPTTANYVIMATTCAPILMKMGVPMIAAHMFVFYFGIVADITPPVALAAYAGSAIAGSNPFKTGVNATKLAIAAFIVPYVFAYSPALLMVDTVWYEPIFIIISAFMGIFGLAMSVNGFAVKKLSIPLRILVGVGGIMLIIPGIVTDVVGISIVGGTWLLQKLSLKKEAAGT